MALIILLGAIGSIIGLHQRAAPTVGGPFSLMDATSGRQVSDAAFRDKWMLVFFGYTQCPDICPVTLSNIAEALSKLGPLGGAIQPIFITLDPERDTPQVLADYVAAFDPRIVGLTGSVEEIAAVAAAYRVTVAKRPLGEDYSVDHTGTVYIMRPDGTFHSSFLPTAGASEMARRLRALLQGTDLRGPPPSRDEPQAGETNLGVQDQPSRPEHGA